jgi:hypothetical protein
MTTLHRSIQRKASVAVFSGFVLIFGTSDLLGREFTDSKGRKFAGEIISVKGLNVTIKRESDQKQFTVPSTTFSVGDQKAIAEFAEAHFKANFEVKYAKKKIDSSSRSDGIEKVTTENWIYKIDIVNKESAPLTGLRVDYVCFRRPDNGGNRQEPVIALKGTKTLEVVKAYSNTSFDTEEMQLNKSKMQGGWTWSNGADSRQADGLAGFVVKVFMKDKEIYRYSTNEALIKIAERQTVAD